MDFNTAGTVESITLDTPGSGYTDVPSIAIGAPSSGGLQATATANLTPTTIPTGTGAITVTNGGYDYVNTPSVFFEGGGATTQATGTVNTSSGVVTGINVTDGGAGYTSFPTVTIVPNAGGGVNAEAEVNALTATTVASITVDESGSRYESVPTVTITGGNGSGATATAVIDSISSNTNILNTDISISREQVRPGGGGVLRLFFSMDFATSPATIAIFNNSTFKGNLNADNSSEVVTDGYYRFDIDVEEGDSVNLQCSTSDINGIHFLQAELVLFGA